MDIGLSEEAVQAVIACAFSIFSETELSNTTTLALQNGQSTMNACRQKSRDLDITKNLSAVYPHSML